MMEPTTTSDPARRPAALTADTVDVNGFYPLDELESMPAEVLEELWLACPDRPFYEAALRQALDDTFGPEAVVGDIDRLSVIDECLLYYTGQHPNLPGSAPRIPTLQKADGTIRWFKVSDRIRERLAAGLPVEAEAGAAAERSPALRTLLPIIGIALTVLCLTFVLLGSAFRGEGLSDAEITATAAAATAGALVPRATLTPTPLALENIDRPIREGDDLRGYYPVLLEIAPEDSGARVFPVQQKAVDIAEWDFDPDPDVASAVLGLVVRPVLGIPHTPDNAAFLGDLAEGDAIRLRMSTGQLLAFTVQRVERVDRQTVSIFDQSAPGIVVVLLQDAAPDRLVIHGAYEHSAEAPDGAALSADAVPEGVSASLGQFDLTVLNTSVSAGPAANPVPGEWLYVLVDLNLQARADLHTGSLTLELIDASGARYAPVAVDGSLLPYAPLRPTALEDGQTLRATAAFLVPRSLAAPSLKIQAGDRASTFSLTYQPPGGLAVSDLDVVILSMRVEGTGEEPGDLLVDVRLFNPHQRAIRVLAGDVAAVYSPLVADGAFPIGPLVQPANDALPLTVAPGEALDVELRFRWNGEPTIGLQVGGYRFVTVLE